MVDGVRTFRVDLRKTFTIVSFNLTHLYTFPILFPFYVYRNKMLFNILIATVKCKL